MGAPARAAAALRQNERAIKSLDEAIQNDPRDPRLKGILAALYLSVGGSPQAYALMRRAAEIRVASDPPAPWQIDGDPGGLTPVRIRMTDRRVRLCVP